MQKEKTRTRIPLKPWHGVAWFAVSMIFLFFGAGILQSSLGMTGLALTELIILALGLLPLLVFDIRLKDMLAIRLPRLGQLIGTFLMWLGTFLITVLLTLVIGYFFPQALSDVSGAMNEMFLSVPGVVAFLIVAVMPAVCEETLHRGFILTSMRSVPKDWQIVLIMAVIFGVFHMDPVRFLGTAILGAGLSYVMVKTRNFLLPVLFHLLNNSVSLLSMFSVPSTGNAISGEAVSSALSSGMALASYLILASVSPLLIFFAMRLLCKKDEQTAREEEDLKPKKAFLRPLLIACSVGLAMLITGVILVIGSLSSSSTSIIMNQVYISDKTEPKVETITVESDRVYNMSYSMRTDIGIIDLTIADSDGNVVYQVSAQDINGSDKLELKKGTYTATFRFVIGDYEEYAKEHGYDYNEKIKKDLGLDGDLSEVHTADISLIIL